MHKIKLFLLSILSCFYIATDAQGAEVRSISELDIDKAVNISGRTGLEAVRLKSILTHASAFEFTDAAFEEVKLSRDVFMRQDSPLKDKKVEAQKLLKSLGLKEASEIDGTYSDFDRLSLDGVYAQLAMASSTAYKDIVEPLSRLSFVLSYREQVKNEDPNGYLRHINALIKRWDMAAREAGTAAGFLNLNYGLSVPLH